MFTSMVPWLPAIIIIMFPRAMPKQLMLFPKMAISLCNMKPNHAQHTRQVSTENTHDSNQILVRTQFCEPLHPEESIEWDWLPEEGHLLPTLPKTVAQISMRMEKELRKVKMNGTATITNDPNHFRNIDMQWSSIKTELWESKKERVELKEELQKQKEELQKHQEKLTHIDDIFNTAEFYKAIKNIKSILSAKNDEESRHCSHPASSLAEKKARIDAIATRNKLAHPLSLESCLRIIDKEPKLEDFFFIVFGLATTDAKALLRFDTGHDFHVKTILEAHACLWKHGLPDTFSASYDKWLVSIQHLALPSKHDQSGIEPPEINHNLVSTLKQLARETCSKADDDLALLESRHFKNENEKSLERWTRMSEKLENQGLLQRLAEWN